MLKIKLTFSILICSSVSAFSQASETEEFKNGTIKTTLTPVYANPVQEPRLSLEEQGFKMYVENGKPIYRKQVNEVVIEFIPEEH